MNKEKKYKILYRIALVIAILVTILLSGLALFLSAFGPFYFYFHYLTLFLYPTTWWFFPAIPLGAASFAFMWFIVFYFREKYKQAISLNPKS